MSIISIDDLRKERRTPLKGRPSIPDGVSRSAACAGGCGRLVAKPEWMLGANIQGKINIMCRQCQRHNEYIKKVVEATDG